MSILGKVAKRVSNTRTSPGSGRIAVYDNKTAPPRLLEIVAKSCPELIDKLTVSTYKECQSKGVSFPFIVLREVVENLIHADFKEIVISVLDDGNKIRISDQGPGVDDKTRIFEPGYTTATREMKKYIRGVGSGLQVVQELMMFSGGTVNINDNLLSGTVITLSMPVSTDKPGESDSGKTTYGLSKRQIAILSLITELSQAGPSEISRELNLGLSTAHRELVCLEEMGLLKSDDQGKRYSTNKGLNSLNKTISNLGVNK